MSDLRVIQADFANWRPVSGRKVLQLILEVPIEQTADVLERLGVPQPGESKWVAVALLENGKCAAENSGGGRKNAPKPSETIEAPGGRNGSSPAPTNAPSARDGTSQKRQFAELPLSQQAALRCGDANFQEFIMAGDADRAAEKVRFICEISSRSELDNPQHAGRIHWQKIEREYQAWLTDRQFAEVRR